MTEQISRDLIEIREHPYRTLFSLLVTLLITLACLIGCAALIAAISKIGILL